MASQQDEQKRKSTVSNVNTRNSTSSNNSIPNFIISEKKTIESIEAEETFWKKDKKSNNIKTKKQLAQILKSISQKVDLKTLKTQVEKVKLII